MYYCFEEIQTIVRSNKFPNAKDLLIDDNGGGLRVSRRGSYDRGMSKYRRSDKLKLKCFICIKKTSHFKKDCPKKEDNEDFVQIAISSNEDNYESVSLPYVSSLEN